MDALQINFWVVVLLVILAVAFDFMNGFHDAANAIATVVSTGVLKPFMKSKATARITSSTTTQKLIWRASIVNARQLRSTGSGPGRLGRL